MIKRILTLFTIIVVVIALIFLPGLAQAQPATDPIFTWGNGADGDLTIPAGGSYNINVNNHPGRICGNGGDGVSYQVIGLTARTATLRNTPYGGCLNAGDEFILINMQGSAGNTGNYELLRVQNVSANLVTFTSNKTKFYGANPGDDSNLGISQRVVLQRVPNYNNVTLNGSLTANAWDGSQYGLAVFKVKGNWIGSGNIGMSFIGYRGGKTGDLKLGGTFQGESWPGPGVISETPNGGGGAGRNSKIGCPGGHGNFAGGAGTQRCPSPNGNVYGAVNLNQLFLGSGGGGQNESNGGAGGGIVYVMANNTNFAGSIDVNGQDGNDTGAGSGGSIRIESTALILGSLLAVGGRGNFSTPAGVGRIALYFAQRWSASFSSPEPYFEQFAAVPTVPPTKTYTRTPNFAATSTSVALTLTARPTLSRTPNISSSATAVSRTRTAQAWTRTPDLQLTMTSIWRTATAQAWTRTPNLPLTLTAIWYNATGTARAQTATAQAGTPDYNATATSFAQTATAQAGTPDYNATATSFAQTATALAASATPDYNATATSFAETATALAASATPDYNATGTALAQTATAMFASSTPDDNATATAQAATLTPDFFASATAMWLTATARAATPTPSPDYNATGTALAETATAQTVTATPDFFASATAMWLTATARAASPTPDLNATSTAQSMTATAQAITSTPDFNATGTAQAQITKVAVNSTATPSAGGGNGSGSTSVDDTPTPSTPGGSFGESCSMTLNVYVYVDSNSDSMMAAQGEGVNSLQVNFLDTSFGKLGQSYTSNGKANFCVPDYLRGQTLRVDIPYLQRTGVMQATQDNTNKNQPLEMWFRLVPPTLPLFIP